MELSPLQRLAAFVLAVLVLAGLGVYLFLPQASARSGARPAGARHRAIGHRAVGHGTAGNGASSPSASGSANAGSPSSAPGTSGSGQAPDIFQWLPFTQAGLASAAQVTVRFADDYATFSDTESTASYLARMQPLITSQLAQLLGRAYATPGLAEARASARQSSSAAATIVALRSFGPNSLTFVVTIAERITSSKGQSTQNAQYAITVTGSGTSWQVSDIELASSGNL